MWKKKAKNLPVGCFLATREQMSAWLGKTLKKANGEVMASAVTPVGHSGGGHRAKPTKVLAKPRQPRGFSCTGGSCAGGTRSGVPSAAEAFVGYESGHISLNSICVESVLL